MMDSEWFTGEMAQKMMEMDYKPVWQQAYDESYGEDNDKVTATRHAEMVTRSQGYGMLRAASYMLTELGPSDDFAESGRQKGMTDAQIKRKWEEERKLMLQKLADKVGTTYEMVTELAADMKRSIAEGMK